MNPQQFLEEMKKIQENLLDYLDDESNVDENLQSLYRLFEELKIHTDQHKLMSLLHLIVKIGNNHHRNPNFFEKIFKVLKIFQDDIKKYYSNTEIFNTFKSNKRILLFLLEEKLMIIDEYITKKIITGKYVTANYPQFFLPEIQPFKNEKWFPKNDNNNTNKWIDEVIKGELPEHFYENRKTGENESFICQLIRNDSVEEFIAYINKNIISPNSKLKPSIYETNKFLIKKQSESNNSSFSFGPKKNNDYQLSLIEYATFFGSIQIIRYLEMNGVDLTPSLWQFAIHGKNADIIHRLEEIQKDVSPDDPYAECLKESIKCHHNDIANYIQNNLINKDNSQENFTQSLKNYNFSFIQIDLINDASYFDICKYGYYLIASYIVKTYDIDINKIFSK
mgnify:CR=1 FL=1